MARILHIEDRPNVAQWFASEAEARGHQVTTRYSIPPAEELHQLLAEHDVVACDGSIDDMNDGANLAVQLKEQGYKVAMSSLKRYGFEGIPDLRADGGWRWDLLEEILG